MLSLPAVLLLAAGAAGAGENVGELTSARFSAPAAFPAVSPPSPAAAFPPLAARSSGAGLFSSAGGLWEAAAGRVRERPRAAVGIGAAAVLALALAAWALRSRRRAGSAGAPSGQEARPASLRPFGAAAAGGVQGLSLPRGLFPGQWLGEADREGLSRWLEQSRAEAVDRYFAALGEGTSAGAPPGPERLSAARDRLALALDGSLRSGELFALCAGKNPPPPEDSAFLSAHLRELMPEIRLPPPPPPELAPRVWAVGLFSAAGAAGGHLAGGKLAGFFGHGALTGALAGAAAGALLLTALALFAGGSEKRRRAFLAATAGIALADAAVSLASGAFLPYPFRGAKSPLWKRALIYAGAALALVALKGKGAFDCAAHRAQVDCAVRSRLESAVSLAAVLLFRARERRPGLAPQGEEKLLAGLAADVRKLVSGPGALEDARLSGLARRLENAGFELASPAGGPEGPEEFPWDPARADLYETFGYIRRGEAVVVEEEPVVRDGKVLRKGQVARR